MIKTIAGEMSSQGNEDEEIQSGPNSRYFSESIGRCDCDSLPSEVLVHVLELVTESTWKDGLLDGPSPSEMGTFPDGGMIDNGLRSQDEAYERAALYPKLFLIVCKRWSAITLNTPILWSYLSITDATTSNFISISLRRSTSLPLSIRFHTLSQMTGTKSFMIELENLLPGILNLRLGNNTSEEDGAEDSSPDFDENILLLLQHAGRWKRFLLLAAHPQSIHRAAFLAADNNCQLRHLEEYRLQAIVRHKEIFNVPWRRRIWNARGKSPFFDRAMPLLHKMALSRGVLPITFHSNSIHLIQDMFPALKELQLVKMGGMPLISLFNILVGLPTLYTLEIVETHFEVEGLEYFQRIKLLELKEFTAISLGGATLACLFCAVSMPNVQSLSIIKTGSLDSLIREIKEASLFPNVQNLTLDSEGGFEEMTKLCSAMPKVVSVHFIVEVHYQGLLGFQWRFLDNPMLSNFSLSGFKGEDIILFVETRREAGIPVNMLRIAKSSITCGDVSVNHGDSLRDLVGFLSWFDTAWKDVEDEFYANLLPCANRS
ncbi:hypothetical protein SCHPADRAFT_909222 [Schizopora paradoxa]|uniref:F-box domain-containing protein n=1 Tax=Schizopora paradoxa TaxID=27342 RepID=A0A0H2R774_9AGAM|nr:hypothetical protein SCHPADRAFT_909222 [Schizopora paradoxa]